MSANLPASSGAKIPSPRRLKNEAKKLRRQDGELTQLAALDLAATARGWPSYKAFEREWRKQPSIDRRHFLVTLSAQWSDRLNSARGTMQAHVQLSEPWWNFLSLAERRQIGTLGDFHIVRADRSRLAATDEYTSWISCAHNLSRAARKLVFIDVMRVLAASQSKAIAAFQGDPHRMLSSHYPNRDHETLWWDPATGLHFILNEPYQIDSDKQNRVLAAREMVAHTTQEWTIHNPSGTLAQLIAPMRNEPELMVLVQRSNALPARFRQIVFTDNEGHQFDIFT